jgi:hypothetical protein
METQFKDIKTKYELLEKRNTELLRQLANTSDETNGSTTKAQDTNTTPTETTPSIPISNKFDPLPDETTENNHNDVNENQHNPQPINTESNPPTKPNETKKPKEHTRVNPATTVILCDSNGRYINTNLLCPDTKTSYIRCPTITKAKSIIENTTFTSPKTFMIHCGTNDLERQQSNDELTNTMDETIRSIQTKHPECRIIISTLLPRNDELNQKAINLNRKLEEIISSKHNTELVNHKNIQRTSHMKDNKHLNETGVRLFALNLKAAYFKTSPRNRNTTTGTSKYANHRNKYIPRETQDTTISHRPLSTPPTTPYDPRHIPRMTSQPTHFPKTNQPLMATKDSGPLLPQDLINQDIE